MFGKYDLPFIIILKQHTVQTVNKSNETNNRIEANFQKNRKI